MSASRGKRRYPRKKELVDAIKKVKTDDELETARSEFADKKVKVSVMFYLEKPEEGRDVTIGKKDLDNMLKLVLDALQTKTDSQGRQDGLGLIANDNYI